MKKNLTIIILIFVLVITAISLAAIAIISSGKTSTNNEASDVSLEVEWTATQVSNSSKATMTANLYLSYRSLSVGSIDGNTLLINGNKHTFSTSSMNENKSEKQRKLLTTFVTEVDRPMGASVECPIEATWELNGKLDGTKTKEVTLNSKVVLEDGNITITQAPETTAPQPTTPVVTDPPVTTVPPVTGSPETTTAAEPQTTPGEQTTASGDQPATPYTGEVFKSDFTLSSDESIALHLRAVCHAESKGDGTATIKVDYYLDYKSLYISNRAVTMTVGDKTTTFNIPTIETDDNTPKTMHLATVDYSAKVGSTITISAKMPYFGTYSGVTINYLEFAKNVILK